MGSGGYERGWECAGRWPGRGRCPVPMTLRDREGNGGKGEKEEKGFHSTRVLVRLQGLSPAHWGKNPPPIPFSYSPGTHNTGGLGRPPIGI